MLCYRCQHRLEFLEEGHKLRFECGEIEKSLAICYAFKPIKPIELKKAKYSGDYGELNKDRPAFGSPLLSARMEVIRDSKIKYELKINKTEAGYVLYYVPKIEE